MGAPPAGCVGLTDTLAGIVSGVADEHGEDLWSRVADQWPRRPPTPGCVTSAPTTRKLDVKTRPGPSEGAYLTFKVNGWYEGGATVITADPLAHGRTHTFGVLSNNGSPANGGWSDEGRCSGATERLATPVISVWAVTTRSASTAASCANGVSCTTSIAGGDGVRTDLRDNTLHGVVATSSDGFNRVDSTTQFATPLLTSPSCSVTGGGQAPNETITVSSSGSNGSRYVRVGSGSWYAGGLSWGGMGAGTWTGYAYATDGFNDTAILGCGSVTVAAPPPPPAPAGYSASFPANCNGYSKGMAEGVWINNYGSTYYGPTGMLFKITGTDANGKPTNISWGMNSMKKDMSGESWTGGVGTCGSGPIGV